MTETASENTEAFSVEVGYLVLDNLQIRIGYNIQSYDAPGFKYDAHYPRGFTVGMDFKF